MACGVGGVGGVGGGGVGRVGGLGGVGGYGVGGVGGAGRSEGWSPLVPVGSSRSLDLLKVSSQNTGPGHMGEPRATWTHSLPMPAVYGTTPLLRTWAAECFLRNG